MSAAVVGNASLSHFDVLVIGSGAGGGAVTEVLCRLGKKVLVLEAGANHFDGLDDPTRQPTTTFSNDELKLSFRNFIYPDPVAEPRTWRNRPSQGDRTFVGDVNGLPKTVGGGAVHADLKMPRFMPDDFHLGTLLKDKSGTSFADWPVDYDMLEPFYAYVERVIGVQGDSIAGDPFAGPRSTPYPMPPGLGMYVALKVADGARALGLHPFAYPTAVNSMPYDGRPACVDCGYCSGYACPSNAKGAPPVTTLRRALLTGNCQLRPETRVVELVMNGKKNAVTGVVAIGPDGKRATFSADRYVLAASPIEDARLLFLSDRAGAGVGNSSGQVGRNLTFHLQTGAVGVFEERVHGHRGRTVTHGFSDFRGKPNDADHPLGGIVEISGSEFPIEEAARYVQIMKLIGGFDGALLKRLMRQSPGRDRIAALALQAEDAPQSTNRVDLDPAVRDVDGLPVPRITYENHPFELHARKVYGPKLVELLGAAGALYAFVAPKDAIPASAHVMGTLRFGKDPKASVCDENGRFHDVGNLYAADGSLFPTSSGFNPTLTLMALATRVACAMVFPGAPEQGLA
ncbi:MAG TPA: GMC family oxidoreductase [Minicystis sp.]|nr:GMC family oxidoreductase [Minicystis sp.]